jgi:hypothetical protein
MRFARVLIYAGITNAKLLLAIWYGYRLYWVTWEELSAGVGVFEIISNINGFQRSMLLYPILLLILFIKLHLSIPSKYLNAGWLIYAVIVSVLGFYFISVMWFIVLIGHGLVGLAIGVLPCLISSILIVILFFVDSPLNANRIP